LRREPVPIENDEEICISYDLERGSGERLFRYGFLEDHGDEGVSRGVTLFEEGKGRVRGGNVFRIGISDVNQRFEDLGFLTYENWYGGFF